MERDSFPLIDRYTSILLDVDFAELDCGRTVVHESDRRLRREPSYGYVRSLLWVWLEDGRSAVSVVPGAGLAVEAIVQEVRDPAALHDARVGHHLRSAVAAVLGPDAPAMDRVLTSCVLACDAATWQPCPHPDCHRLVDASRPTAAGLTLPAHCFPDGIAYGVVRGALWLPPVE